MKVKDHPLGAGVLGVILIVAGFDMLLEAISLLVRYEEAAGAPLPWRFDAFVVFPILLAALLYALGLRRPQRPFAEPSRTWRHAAFFVGLAVLYLVLESPFDAIAGRLFLAHQLQHMTLAMAVPMLIVLSAPQAILLRGLPERLRRGLVTPFFGSRFFRLVSILAHPAVATPLYIAVNYFWMMPPIHDLALADEPIHALLHASLLLTGLLFFWRILDPRPYPIGPALGVRLFMFWLAAIADILLGSFLAFKSVALYHAYGPSPHLFGIAALDDERYGGLTMWIPGAGMLAAATLLTIRNFALEEERRERRRPATGASAADLLAPRRAANRKMALGLCGFAAIVLLITIATVLLYHFGSEHRFLALL
ncbi:MAG TPA: cytochrome c oxidase assembly protein [Stellaceae bacterium]|nr:cytochrome c oxidase assembly protein [Stellaceae bacterium]